jgi:hypothetical protein
LELECHWGDLGENGGNDLGCTGDVGNAEAEEVSELNPMKLFLNSLVQSH